MLKHGHHERYIRTQTCPYFVEYLELGVDVDVAAILVVKNIQWWPCKKTQQKSIRYENKLTETHSTVLLNAMREKILAKFSFLVMHRQHVQEGLYYLTLGHATPITDF